MKRIMSAVLTITALSVPVFAQRTQPQSTTTTKTATDVQRDKRKVAHDKADLKADRAADKSTDVKRDQVQLHKDRANLKADRKTAHIPSHKHARKSAKTSPTTTKR